MRIFLFSMPLLALVAILAASADRKLDYSAQRALIADDKALPEAVALFEKIRQVQALKDQRVTHGAPTTWAHRVSSR